MRWKNASVNDEVLESASSGTRVRDSTKRSTRKSRTKKSKLKRRIGGGDERDEGLDESEEENEEVSGKSVEVQDEARREVPEDTGEDFASGPC
jgi:hypothetical protein